MKYKLAIFDMDGTILDTLVDLAEAVNYALRKAGIKERSLQEIRSYLGNGMLRLILLAAPEDASAELLAELKETFTEYYKAHCSAHTRPYDGIVELIEELRSQGVKTAVVSNKPDFGVQLLVKDYFPTSFDAAVGERIGIAKKPAPDSVNEVLRLLDISREEAVYIGDSEVDIETARNAGMTGVIVTWGFRDEAYLLSLKPDVLVHDIKELRRELL